MVIGDAAEKFSYQNLNDAFRVLIGLEKPVLFSLGKGYGAIPLSFKSNKHRIVIKVTTQLYYIDVIAEIFATTWSICEIQMSV